MDKKAMYQLTYGLFVLTAKDGEKDNGCIINTAMQVTTNPNQIIIVVCKDNHTHDLVMKTGEFNVSILSEKAPFETFKNWGFQSGKDTDKTVGITYNRAENGIIYLEEVANAYISGKVISTTDVGTHTIFLAEVTDARSLDGEDSMTYSFYQSKVKPAAKQEDAKKGYVCVICGYIYEGDPLPEDFVCPICKHGAADFVKLT